VEDSGLPVIITYPNSDAGGRAITDHIEEFRDRYPAATVRINLGTKLYLGLLRHAAVLVGNSSSGIIEAGSFGLPVVNVGERQQGRLRGPNVIDVATERVAILEGIRKALDPNFREDLASKPNPYDSGEASQTIVRVLKEVELGQRLLQKRLPDLPYDLVNQAITVGASDGI
jgi:UDP-N-acetylglucosamine 2-epimerase